MFSLYYVFVVRLGLFAKAERRDELRACVYRIL